jgi:mitochondrial GTPase 1
MTKASALQIANSIRSFNSRYGASISWFPGHMSKTVSHLADLIPKMDIILEIRDARIPFSSYNPLLDEICGPQNNFGHGNGSKKHRIIIFNKADLANEQLQSRLTQIFSSLNQSVLFTSAINGTNVSKILSIANKIPLKTLEFKVTGVTMLIVGIPNVGKSSLINILRQKAVNQASTEIRKRGALTGASPGLTRSVRSFKITDKPHPIYLFDTPGVLAPRISDIETGMKLFVTNAVKETLVPYKVATEYLLWYFEGIGSTKFQDLFGLSKAFSADEVDMCLRELATKKNLTMLEGEPDLEAAGRVFVRAFQAGDIGRFTLDVVPTLEAFQGASE